MKIEQDAQTFQPVVITLEGMEEVNALYAAISAREEVLAGNEEKLAELDFLAAISEFLGDV
jgi:hypothetical protein